MRRLLTLTLIVWLTALPPGVSAQAGASVAGTVSDQRGAVIQGAKVDAHNLASGLLTTTQTDSSGRYEFGGLPPGDYRVSVSSEGFSTAARAFHLRLDR